MHTLWLAPFEEEPAAILPLESMATTEIVSCVILLTQLWPAFSGLLSDPRPAGR